MERLPRRLALNELLVELAKPFVKKGDKTSHVYYNPPTGFQLEFPCFVYEDGDPNVNYADNLKYCHFPHWKITTISRDRESADLAPLLEKFPRCSYSTSFISDNLAHRVYDFYY